MKSWNVICLESILKGFGQTGVRAEAKVHGSAARGDMRKLSNTCKDFVLIPACEEDGRGKRKLAFFCVD